MNPQIISETEAPIAYADNLVESPLVGNSAKPGPTMIDTLILFALHKRIIARVAGITTVIGIVISVLLPVRYTATTQIMTPQQTESTAMMMMMAPFASASAGSMAALASGGLSLKSPNDLYIGILTSRPIADAIIQKFDLVKSYHARDMTAARKRLTKYTTIQSEKSGLISIEITDKDKVRAAEMANSYTEQLRSITQTMAATEASQRRQFYERQLKEAKDDLVAAETAFQQVEQTRGVIQPTDQARVIIGSLASLRAGITEKKVELQALRSYSTDRNPQVQLAENELAALQAAEDRMAQKQHTGGFSNLGLGDVPGAGLDYLKAQHELLYRQTLFDLLIKQYDAAKLDEAKSATVIRVVATAIPPDRKASPQRILIILLSLLAGIVISCSGVYLNELLRKNPGVTRSIADLRSALTK